MTNEEIEKEIKGVVINYFESEHKDEFGYVTDKVNKIKELTFDNLWVAFSMLHPLVKLHLYQYLSKGSQQYLIDNKIFKENGKLA